LLKLDQLYFRSFLILFIITVLLTSTIGYIVLKNSETNSHKTMLLSMIYQFSILEDRQKSKDEAVKEIYEKTLVRVTIINPKGEVISESSRDIKGMDNHLNREEIQMAISNDVGFSVRYSKSVDKDYLYVAKKFPYGFIRMAYALDTIKAKFFDFWIKSIAFISLILLFAFWIALRINEKIALDLSAIKNSLDNLLNKKYESLPNTPKCCREFETISKQIDKVALKLQKRDSQKNKITKNLKLHTKKQADIISAISHEFKNPVAAIMGYAQSVREDADLNLEIRNRFLDKVIKNGEKISFMIDRLSMAVRLESDVFVPNLTTFKISSLLMEVKDTLLQKYKDREIILEIEDITIKADRSMFDNLLLNLVDNALKYSEDAVIIRVKDAKLEVIDKGIGISEENIKNITKRFFRVDNLSWDNSMGVGLYIVKYILKLHNITLAIDSNPLKGSKFWFTLKNLIK